MLKSRFNVKDIGLADVILGIKLSRIPDGFVLNQSHYGNIILEKFNKDDSGMARTSKNTSQHLSRNKDESISPLEYSRITRRRLM